MKKVYFAAILVLLVSMLLNLAVGIFYRMPVPAVHDEFSYLLAGDTFSKGRLSNPPHEMWKHFDTFHIFFNPYYQSKYPPGQGMFLAIGQYLFNEPIVGVWISYALGSLAFYWVLIAFLPPVWALTGAFILMFNPNIINAWGQSYWGGAVAMFGGMLFLGSLIRLSKEIKLKYSVILGVSLMILANSRPVEGAITVAACAPFIMQDIFNKYNASENKRDIIYNFILPLAATAFLMISFLLYYNYRTTGDPFSIYYLHWNHENSPIKLIRSYGGSPPQPIIYETYRLWKFFLGPFLSLALIGLYTLRSEIYFRRGILVFAVVLAFSTIFTRAHSHYLAPIVSFVYAGIALGLYSMARTKIFNKYSGKQLASIILILYFSYSLFLVGNKIYIGPTQGWADSRHMIERELIDKKGKDLVFVRYIENHNIHGEWVYNKADIDRSEVVWARDLSKEENLELIKYFNNRAVWLVHADKTPRKLQKYR